MLYGWIRANSEEFWKKRKRKKKSAGTKMLHRNIHDARPLMLTASGQGRAAYGDLTS